MAQFTLKSVPQVSPRFRKEYIVDFTDFKQIGASLTGDIILETFDKDTIVDASNVRVTTLFAGTAITDVDVQLKFGAATSESNVGSSLDIDTALGSTLNTTRVAGSTTAANQLIVAFTSVGGNANALTAGVLKVVVNLVHMEA